MTASPFDGIGHRSLSREPVACRPGSPRSTRPPSVPVLMPTALPGSTRCGDAMTMADRLRDLHAQLEAGVAELVSGDAWVRMLNVASRFHQYSSANVMLILCQQPDASRVAGYRTWQRLGRQVRRGE